MLDNESLQEAHETIHNQAQWIKRATYQLLILAVFSTAMYGLMGLAVYQASQPDGNPAICGAIGFGLWIASLFVASMGDAFDHNRTRGI